VQVYEDNAALVGDDTLVLTEDDDDGRRALMAALDRGRGGEGFPAARLADAERETGVDDPFVLATGDLSLAGAYVEEPSLRRARREVPWLRAVRNAAGALRLEEDRADLVARVVTDASAIGARDLPVGPAGELELPLTNVLAGASRDQSYTTTFASRTARALFAGSRFARAVERTERELGVRFEDEVLRQFSCPSASVFDPETERFAARSCLRDPERMRRLLPRLAPHLPRILTSMQALGDEAMAALLLIAPDAPLTPSFVTSLAAIAVERFRDDEEPPADERLYVVTGLRDERGSGVAQAGPDRVVFGMIGDAFVVGSDGAMARRAAKMRTRGVDERAGSVIATPLRPLLDQAGRDGSPDAALLDVLGDLRLTATADRDGLTARGRISFAD
jgi:hypothetical protein